MIYTRRSRGQIALLILSLLGSGVAVYLTAVHYQSVPLICSPSGFIDCARVLSSSYSVVPGTTIPISIPGLFWCVVSAALALVGWRLGSQRRSLRLAEFAWTLLGMLTAFYLIYVEIVQLHTICAWCTVLHAIILVMFLITIWHLQEPVFEEEFEEEFEGEEAKA
ncbi:MAG TPA: vitamin K epoxide reductase family protein [Ktedonobacteraceae bacterium]|nr:vitamin K epoxide reductase family protein [Ktedonobacteraceae bacterium]